MTLDELNNKLAQRSISKEFYPLSRMDKRILSAIKFIEDNIDRKLTLNDLARLSNLSPSRLRHLFKVEVGITPTQYLRSHRMEVARKLLENTFMTEKQIMNKIGVNDASHFVRDFKKVFGSTPTLFRGYSRAPRSNDTNHQE